MREMDLASVMQSIVLRRNRILDGIGSSMQLTLPLNLSKFLWHDRSLEKLIEKFIHHVSLISQPARPVRVALRQKARMLDLEKFFGIYPSYWIQLRIEGQGPAVFEAVARPIFEDLGYRCEEWVGVEDSGQHLAAFCLETEHDLKLVFWADNPSRRCDLLIPVTKPICLTNRNNHDRRP
jgi:hypothetical protein